MLWLAPNLPSVLVLVFLLREWDFIDRVSFIQALIPGLAIPKKPYQR
jgi:hypothetical protein